MISDEKFIKKLDKLLKSYGVIDEEQRKYFIDDFKTSVDENDDEEVNEVKEEQETNNELEKVEKPEEVNETEVEDANGGEEVDKVEEPEGGKVEETETPEPENGEEEQVEEQPKEEVQEVDYNALIDELKKTNEGLNARLAALEDIIEKLGYKEENKSVGVSPVANGQSDEENDAFDYYVRKRKGI